MRYLLLTIIIVIFAGALVWFGKIAYQKPPETVTEADSLPKLSAPTVTFIDPVRGNREAPITIVEFSDYRCEFCQQIESVLQQVLSAYPNDVRLVWKDFPNDYLHSQASALAVAVRCAGNVEKYWEYHDALLDNAAQNSLISYADLAATLSLDRTAFQACIDTRLMDPRVEKTLEEAQALRLTGTPSFFINGRPFNGTTFEEFKAVIDGILK